MGIDPTLVLNKTMENINNFQFGIFTARKSDLVIKLKKKKKKKSENHIAALQQHFICT